MIKVYNKNGDVIYKTDLTGIDLYKHYAEELDMGWNNKWDVPGKGSMIMELGNLSRFKLDQDIKLVIELIARNYNYMRTVFDIKPFVVTPNNDIIFYELGVAEW